jgi:hypothetical protein
MLPLTTADLLAHAIVGSVLENLDMERLVREVGHAVAQRILGNNESVDDVARELHEKLLLRNESTKKVVIETIYKESEEAKHNVSVYMNAASLTEARPLLQRVSRCNSICSQADRIVLRRSREHDLLISIYKRVNPSLATHTPTDLLSHPVRLSPQNLRLVHPPVLLTLLLAKLSQTLLLLVRPRMLVCSEQLLHPHRSRWLVGRLPLAG